MRMRISFITAILLIALLAFTASIALADDTLPPTEEPTDPEDSTEQTERMPGQNPVAWFLSQYFAEDEELGWELDPESEYENNYDYIMGLHETYGGFGNLARAFYLYSQVNNPDEEFILPEGSVFPEDFTGSFEDFLALREDYGWGVLYKSLGKHPNEGSLGWAFKNAEDADKPGNGPKWGRTDETDDPDESYDPYAPYDPYASGGTEVTGTGGKPDKPDKPGKAENPGKSDHAGKKDKKPKDK